MWLKILLQMIQQGFCSPQNSLTVDTKAVANPPTPQATGTLGIIVINPESMINRIVILFILTSLSAVSRGQDLLMLSDNFTNGKINNIDTLDALVKNSNYYKLVSTQVKRDSFYNPAWTDMQTCYKYKLPKEPIMFFKYHSFKRNEIIGEEKAYVFVSLETVINYSIGNNTYTFRSTGTLEDHGGYKTISNYEITISAVENGEKHLFSLIKCLSIQISSKDFNEAPKLIWIGDLDNDNKLDLIISESTHHAMFSRSLYLSSERNENKYVRKAGVSGSID